MINKLIKNQKGFTLVELIIVSMIISIIVLGITSFMKTTLNSHNVSTSNVNKVRALRSSLDNTFKEIQTAEKIEINASGSLVCTFPDASVRTYSLNSDHFLTDGKRIISSTPLDSLEFIEAGKSTSSGNPLKTVTIKITLPHDSNEYITTVTAMNVK